MSGWRPDLKICCRTAVLVLAAVCSSPAESSKSSASDTDEFAGVTNPDLLRAVERQPGPPPSSLNRVSESSIADKGGEGCRSWDPVRELARNADLLDEDAVKCLERCAVILQRAEEHGDSAAAAVALMQRACARTCISTFETGVPDARTAMGMFPLDVPDCMQILFSRAVLFRQRMMESDEAGSDPLPLNLSPSAVLRGEALKQRFRLLCDEVEYQLREGHLSSRLMASGHELAARVSDEHLMARWTYVILLTRYEPNSQKHSRELLARAEELIGSSDHSRPFPRELRVRIAMLICRLHTCLGNSGQSDEWARRAVAEAKLLNNHSTLAECCVVRLQSCEQGNSISGCFESLNDVYDLRETINRPDVLRAALHYSRNLGNDGTGIVDREQLINAFDSRIRMLERRAIHAGRGLRRWSANRVSALVAAQGQRIFEAKQHADQKARQVAFATEIGVIVSAGLLLILVCSRRSLSHVNRRLQHVMTDSERVLWNSRHMELRLAETERLESLGALAGGIAHDFNNLLVGVIGNADLMMQSPSLSPADRQCLDGILRSAMQASALSRRMLDYAGRRIPEQRPVELNAAIHSILPLLRTGFGSCHSITFRPCPADLILSGNGEQIDQVLLNLVHNAVRASQPRSGQIEITTGSCLLNPSTDRSHLFGRNRTHGAFVWFEVSDRGHGIPDDDLPLIFEPFCRVKNSGDGHGLGLAVVQTIVNQHDGLIQVWSRPDCGSRFRILFPKRHSCLQDVTSVPIASEKTSSVPFLTVSEHAGQVAGSMERLTLDGK